MALRILRLSLIGLVALGALLVRGAATADPAAGVIVAVAGGGVGDGADPQAASLSYPSGVALSAAGDVYIAETGHCRVRLLSAGVISTAADASVDGICAPLFTDLAAIALDESGKVYIADAGACVVEELSAGVLTRIAGTGICGYNNEGLAATSSRLNSPKGVAVDHNGDVYIADTSNCRVRRVSAGVITTVVGTGSCTDGGDGGPATSAGITYPKGIVFDALGDLYIAAACSVRKVSSGIITTVAGNGTCAYSGDGGQATSAGVLARSLAIDSGGNLYVADDQTCRIREVAGGTIVAIAGNGTCGYSGDGGAATSAMIDGASGIAASATDELYIADTNNCRLRRVSDGVITSVAGNGGYLPGYPAPPGVPTRVCAFAGENDIATNAEFAGVGGLATGVDGSLYLTDSGNCRVRKVSAGLITTIAGNGTCAVAGDSPVPALSAPLAGLSGIAVTVDGDVYISEAQPDGCRVRKLSGGIMTTVVGDGTCAFAGDGGPAASAHLYAPGQLAVDGAGNVYIGDDCRVRKVSGGGISTIAGNGTCTYSGDGGPATSAGFRVGDLAVDALGDVYIADSLNCRVRRVSAGIITTIAGNGTCAYSGDGGPSTGASLDIPRGVAVDQGGNVYVSGYHWESSVGGFTFETDCRVRQVTLGIISTVAGGSQCANSGDDGAATSARLYSPTDLAGDSAGNVYIDTSNRVRELVAPDSDGDGCSDLGELTLAPATNPADPWDFYSVPVPALFAAENPLTDFRDGAVGASDAQAVFAYFKAGARSVTPVYEHDLNNNGILDGREYDRSVVGPGMSGPPDGVVSAEDAQLAFAQFKMRYRC